jgi:hypothetical protein
MNISKYNYIFSYSSPFPHINGNPRVLPYLTFYFSLCLFYGIRTTKLGINGDEI